MTKRMEVYKCEKCGSLVEALNGVSCTLNCCGTEMKLMEEQSADKSVEKHVPIIEEIEDGIRVKVGSTPHPMEEKHYIQWIEVINGDYIQRKYLKPGDKPEALFYVKYSDTLIAREYCNVHGHWSDRK